MSRKAYSAAYHKLHKAQQAAADKKYRDTHKSQAAAKDRKYYQEHKQQKIEYKKAYDQTHKQQSHDYGKSYYQKNKAGFSVRNRKYFYGINQAEYQQMRTEQENKCRLCFRYFEPTPGPSRITAPRVDHDHSYLENHGPRRKGCASCVRGLVCHQCNIIVIPFLELYPNRQTPAEAAYMADRPILRYRSVHQ